MSDAGPCLCEGEVVCQFCCSIASIKSFCKTPKDFQKILSLILEESPRTSWDQYFINIARLASIRSKDSSTKVGAVIVKDRNIISTGFNGFPRGINDKLEFRYERPEKYFWTIHAEENAIFNACSSGVSVKDATIYVTPMHPCVECAKAIIQSGIKSVVYEELIKNDRWIENFDKSRQILSAAGILVRFPE